jgi:hypothetical protein
METLAKILFGLCGLFIAIGIIYMVFFA